MLFRSGTACTHGREGLVTRGVQEGDDAAILVVAADDGVMPQTGGMLITSLPATPLEAQANLDFNLDRLSLPAEADGPLEQWTIPPLVCRGGVASLLHPTEGRIEGAGSTKHANLHAAACCPGGGASCRVQRYLTDRCCRFCFS